MAEDEEIETEETEEKDPFSLASSRAEELGLDGEEYDDYVEARMRRHGYKRGPGEWVKLDGDDDDDESNDDDDEPMTRGDWRKMQKKQRSQPKVINPPPRKKPAKNAQDTKKRRDPWW